MRTRNRLVDSAAAWLASALLVGLGGGCFKSSLSDARAVPTPETRIVWMPTWLFGTIGDPRADVRDLCASGLAERAAIQSDPLVWAVAIGTLGVFTPRVVAVRCGVRR